MKRKHKKEGEEIVPRSVDTPTDEFCEWWYPHATDEPSGAGVGGHPDAARVWARHDPGRWLRRTYGISAQKAWLCQCYRDQFNAWIKAGRPEREPYVSIALPLDDERHELVKEMMSIVRGDKDA